MTIGRGFLKVVQRASGRALLNVHRAGGFRVDYTLARDTTVEGMSSIVLAGIYIWPTPLVKEKVLQGNQTLEVMSAAGNLSAEALPIFMISREALKINGVFFDPTFHDEFVETGTTKPIFRVIQITDIAAPEPGWFITTSTVFRSRATG